MCESTEAAVRQIVATVIPEGSPLFEFSYERILEWQPTANFTSLTHLPFSRRELAHHFRNWKEVEDGTRSLRTTDVAAFLKLWQGPRDSTASEWDLDWQNQLAYFFMQRVYFFEPPASIVKLFAQNVVGSSFYSRIATITTFVKYPKYRSLTEELCGYLECVIEAILEVMTSEPKDAAAPNQFAEHRSWAQEMLGLLRKQRTEQDEFAPNLENFAVENPFLASEWSTVTVEKVDRVAEAQLLIEREIHRGADALPIAEMLTAGFIRNYPGLDADEVATQWLLTDWFINKSRAVEDHVVAFTQSPLAKRWLKQLSRRRRNGIVPKSCESDELIQETTRRILVHLKRDRRLGFDLERMTSIDRGMLNWLRALLEGKMRDAYMHDVKPRRVLRTSLWSLARLESHAAQYPNSQMGASSQRDFLAELPLDTREILASLSPFHRELVYRHYFLGQSEQQVAETVAVDARFSEQFRRAKNPYNVVRRQLPVALSRLRLLMTR